ncbi:MAG TPA: multiheme c-type cytochrome [Bryobacteraceae bacterium]|nr:multiheme c-type cytochrome [Bryobacteraceae bacterium]
MRPKSGNLCYVALLPVLLMPLQAAQNFTCASCHKQQAESQPRTPMGHALELPGQCSILQKHPHMTFREGAYRYDLTTEGGHTTYTVTDGAKTVTLPIGWALGLGAAGQTYIYEKDGRYYESRVSWFDAIDGLDITIGATRITPRNIDEAAGRLLPVPDAQECFQCHSTGAVVDGHLQTAALTPGVQCRRCHDQAEQHLEGMRAGNTSIIPPRLGKLSAEQMSNFCGQCHRTWERVAMQGPRGVANVRFQPYRLANSKCFDGTDPRISCIACHDPHQDVVRDAAAYDSKCLACHQSKSAAAADEAAKRTAPACPVSQARCVTCHMPKLDLPGGHAKFTDHQIRVVRNNEPYPN